MVSDDQDINHGGPYFEMFISPMDSESEETLSATSSYSVTGNNGTQTFVQKQWNGINGIEAKGYECEGHCYEDIFIFRLKNNMVGSLDLVPRKLCPLPDPEDDPGNGTCPNPNKEVQGILSSFQMISGIANAKAAGN